MYTNSPTTTQSRIPRFLVGRARTQWKAMMVRNTPVEQAAVRVITIDDVMGEIAASRSTLELAA